jgi:ribosome-associated protein
LNAQELANAVAQLILEKKGKRIIIQDLRGLTSMTDFFVICTVDADVQAKAVVEHIKEQLRKQSIKPWHTEGSGSSSWVLVDLIDVVVHIFRQDARMFYNLERLWGDAPWVEIKDENEAAAAHTEES